MATLPPSGMSRALLEAHIRSVAADSGRVYYTRHALARMKQRHLTREIVQSVLREGRLRWPAEPNPSKGSLECRMERHVAGSDIGVVVAVSDDDPGLVVITAMTTGN